MRRSNECVTLPKKVSKSTKEHFSDAHSFHIFLSFTSFMEKQCQGHVIITKDITSCLSKYSVVRIDRKASSDPPTHQGRHYTSKPGKTFTVVSREERL